MDRLNKEVSCLTLVSLISCCARLMWDTPCLGGFYEETQSWHFQKGHSVYIYNTVNCDLVINPLSGWGQMYVLSYSHYIIIYRTHISMLMRHCYTSRHHADPQRWNFYFSRYKYLPLLKKLIRQELSYLMFKRNQDTVSAKCWEWESDILVVGSQHATPRLDEVRC